MSGPPPKDGVIGRPSLWIAEDLGAALQVDGENEVRGDGLKHQKEKRSMDHFGGLDVSVKETSICMVDDTGRIVKEVKVASEPACSPAEGSGEPHLPLQADRTRSRAVIAMAVQ